MAMAMAAAPKTPAPTWLLLAAPVNLVASVVAVALLDLVVVGPAVAKVVFGVVVAETVTGAWVPVTKTTPSVAVTKTTCGTVTAVLITLMVELEAIVEPAELVHGSVMVW